MKNLAEILTHLMTEAGIKSAELARKTVIGQPVIYRLMTGTTENPQILTLKPIADFFHKSIDQLLGFAPLDGNRSLPNESLHEICNKLSSIRTVASALIDFMPSLIEGYQQALSACLIKENISSDILPLLLININNQIKTANYIQELLLANNNEIRNDYEKSHTLLFPSN